MSERVYVVSGAASGIGAATTARLRADGHRVVTVDLRDTDVTADLSTPDGRAAAVAGVRELADVVHGVVPAAGIAGYTGDDPQLLVSVNHFGAVGLVEGLRDLMADDAAVVFLSSNSVTCQPGWPTELVDVLLSGDEDAARAAVADQEAVQVYPVTKAAVARWARREAASWAEDGVRLNAVAPGMIATPMTERLRADPVLGAFADAYPTAIGRPGRPDEVAAAITFLLGQESSLVVGAVLTIDGGTDAMLNG